MILGMGSQIIECVRVRRLIERHGETFITRVYTPREIVFCRDRAQSTEHYSAVWAAKEAVLRSLGMTWKAGIAWTDVEIDCENAFSPKVVLAGHLKERADALGVRTVFVSMAHTRNVATAHAVAVNT